VNITDQRRAATRNYFQPLFRFVSEKLPHNLFISYPVNAYVNDGCARFDMLAAYKARASYGRYENICLLCDGLKVARLRVTNGHGCIAL
jgi:hypothetical protein